MEFGICAFGDISSDLKTGKLISVQERLNNLLQEIKYADELGLDVFAVGEHHREDYVVSSPAVVLAAAASITKHIRLSSGVTVLSSDDPVRVYQQFSTLDLLSNGRAEIMAGRGSFIESFPLFGFDLHDYDELFSEKLELLLEITQNNTVKWKGKHRASIDGLSIFPKSKQQPLPVWIAIGGTPESAIRAGKLGLPLTLAIIGGFPDRFVPLVNLYRKTFLASGHAHLPKVGINSHLFVAETTAQAMEIYFPSYAKLMSKIGKERGWSAMTKQQFELMREPEGSLIVGSTKEVADKLIYEYDLFGYDRFLAQIGVGELAHKYIVESIKLYAEQVLPVVKKYIEQKTKQHAIHSA